MAKNRLKVVLDELAISPEELAETSGLAPEIIGEVYNQEIVIPLDYQFQIVEGINRLSGDDDNFEVADLFFRDDDDDQE